MRASELEGLSKSPLLDNTIVTAKNNTGSQMPDAGDNFASFSEQNSKIATSELYG